MKTFLSCVSIFLICTTSHVRGLTKVPCALDDVACTTEGLKPAYLEIVSGNPDIAMPSLEPMRIDQIEAVTPTLNYTLSNVQLHGLINCYHKKLEFLLNQFAWHYYFVCPHLELKSDYYIYGDINDIHLEGEGKAKIVYDDYHIAMFGHVETYQDTEGKVHINTKKFVLQELDVEGGIIYKFEDLFHGDEEKSELAHGILNKKWNILESVIQKPMMKLVMGKFVDNTNIFVKAHDVRQLFYKYV